MFALGGKIICIWTMDVHGTAGTTLVSVVRSMEAFASRRFLKYYFYGSFNPFLAACPFLGGCPLLGGSVMGGSTVLCSLALALYCV